MGIIQKTTIEYEEIDLHKQLGRVTIGGGEKLSIPAVIRTTILLKNTVEGSSVGKRFQTRLVVVSTLIALKPEHRLIGEGFGETLTFPIDPSTGDATLVNFPPIDPFPYEGYKESPMEAIYGHFNAVKNVLDKF